MSWQMLAYCKPAGKQARHSYNQIICIITYKQGQAGGIDYGNNPLPHAGLHASLTLILQAGLKALCSQHA